MRRRAAAVPVLRLLTLALWLAAPAILAPADALSLTIQGRVLRGEERAPAKGIPVSLHLVKGEEELPGSTLTSDAKGAFRFEGVREEPGLSYYVSTEYKGAYYTEGPIEVHPPGTPHEAAGKTLTQDLVIYEVGREMGTVRVTHHHVVVERNPDHLHVTEILIFQNDGKTAYLGTGLNHAESAGVRLGLPASVENFEPGVGGDDQTVRVQGRDLTGIRPIPPGSRPFSFSYHVPLSGRMDLSHRLYYPTDKVVVMLNDPALKLESGMLRYTGPREQGGKKFEVYEASMVPTGAEIEMRVHGASFWSNPKIYPWLAAPFVIVAVLIVAAKRGRRVKEAGAKGSADHAAGGPGGQTAAHPEPLRVHAPAGGAHASPQARLAPQSGSRGDGGEDLATVYLYLIDALDRGLEQGEYSKESHALIRGNLKRRLETILSSQPQARAR
ncbi:MAG TPA: hypothetical protein VFP58_13375 [Candidatus Eisenbacteria bacterium]|nr:hypothetical protein [Candidatus Eisenbacteria bacterium]